MIKYLFSTYLLMTSYNLNKTIIITQNSRCVIEIFIFDKNITILFKF